MRTTLVRRAMSRHWREELSHTHLHVGHCDHAEGLVDLPEIDIRGRDAGSLQRDRSSESRSDGELQRRSLGISKACDARERLQAETLGTALAHQQQGRRSIVEGRRVGSSDGSVLGEGRSKLRHLAKVDAVVLLRQRRALTIVRDQPTNQPARCQRYLRTSSSTIEVVSPFLFLISTATVSSLKWPA